MNEKQEEAPHGMSEELDDFMKLFCKITNLGDINGDEIHKNSPQEIAIHLQRDKVNPNK